MTNIKLPHQNVNIYDDIIIEPKIDICYVNKEETNKKIGDRIKELRTQKGWSQSDLARACDKDRQAIERLENGKTNPTIFSLFEVSKALNIKVKDLINF